MGNQIFLTVLSLSLSGTLIGILILCIRPLTKRIFSKKWNYYVWLVMVARLILPISLGINLMGYLFASGNTWNSAAAESAIRVEIPEPVAEVEPVTADHQLENSSPVIVGENQGVLAKKPVPSPVSRQMVFSWFWIVWLFGAMLSACIKGNDYRNFAAYVKVSQKEIAEGKVRQIVDELSGRLGIKRAVKVYESPMISGPILIGLLHPCMILPEGSSVQEDLSLILHHELIHYKKKDLWYKWLYQVVLCIHWFNPLFYLIARKLNTDCELACDEAVMEILTVEGRKAYGNVLLDAAEQKLKFKKSVLATTLLEDKGTLKERLCAILHYKKTKGILAVLSLGLLGMIVVLAGFAGAKDSKTYNTHSPAGMLMAGGYISAWDTAADNYISAWDNTSSGYMSLWDAIGEAVGVMWDGIGEMWGDLGDALHDVDPFLLQTTTFDTNGEAWKVYEDDAALAGKDIHDRWQAYSYQGGGKRIKCEGLILNGSDTFEILYAKEAFTQTVDFEAELKSGRMKLIHVGADGTVTLLAEMEEGDSINDSFDISLTEGRNAIKIVGQGAKIKKLSFKFEKQNDKKVLKLFSSEEGETAELIRDEFLQGNVDVDRFMDALPYMNGDDLCECAKILFDSGANLTMDQIYDLVIYGDDCVGEYLADAVEKGTIEPFTGEEIRENLVYYISSADTLRLVENMDGGLDFDTMKELLFYLNKTDGEKCLNIYLEQGNELSYEEFLEISFYLGEDVAKKLYEKGK